MDVDGQVQISAQVQPRPEFQDSGLRVVRPVRRVRLTVYDVLHRFYPNHRAAIVHHAVDVRPIVFRVGIDAKSSFPRLQFDIFFFAVPIDRGDIFQ